VGFLGLGTPKWRHKDVAVRQAAIQRLQSYDGHILVRIALNDPDAGLRAQAASRVTAEGDLRRLLASTDPKVVGIARERLGGVLVTLARAGSLAEVRDVLAQIDEQKALSELTLTAKDPGVRAAAFERLLADAEPSQALLATIAIQDADGAFAARAVARLAKRGPLKDVAKKAKSPAVRAAAQAKTDALDAEAERPSPEQRRKARAATIEPLVARAARAGISSDWRTAGDELEAIGADVDALLGEYADLPADDALAAARARIERARAAIAQRKAEAERAAAAEAGALAARERFLAVEAEAAPGSGERESLIAAWKALGAAPAPVRHHLDRRFTELLVRRFPASASSPLPDDGRPARPAWKPATPEALAELTSIAGEAEALVERAAGAGWRDAEHAFKVLHKRWLGLAQDLEPSTPERMRFLAAWNAFKDRRRAVREERDQVSGERLAELQRLCAEAERLAVRPAAPGDERARFDELKRLQAAWKAGPMPPERLAGGVRERFRAAIDRAFAPLQAFREAEEWERFANVAKAEALTAEVEALAAQDDLPAVAKAVRQAHQRWKDLGGLPRDRQQALWTAFKTACDTQYDRCKVHFAEQDAKRAAALERKRALVAEAEALAAQGTVGLAGSPADRAAKDVTAAKLKALQGAWKDAGPAPRDRDEQLWTAFRSACDGFFAGYNAVRDQERRQNLARKIELIESIELLVERAEGLPGAVGADKERWLRQVKDAQAQWKMVGHVPREDQDAVWTRFRAACDRIYRMHEAQYAESPDEQAANLTAKRELLDKLEAIANGEPGREARDEVKQLQLRWRSIGGIPLGEGSGFEARWRELCDRVFASGTRS
jgi:hypothetical protein